MNYDSFLFEGHGYSELTGGFDPGAVNGSVTENTLADAINKAAAKYLAPTGLNIHYDENNYTDNDLKGNVYKYNCGISTHINSTQGATGVEIWVANKEGYLIQDTKLVEEISKLLGIPNRGVKSKDFNTGQTYVRKHGEKIQAQDYYKEIRDAWNQGISLAILEVGFIQEDLNKIQNRIDEIGYLVAKYIAANCDKTLQDRPEAYKPRTGYLNVKPFMKLWSIFKDDKNFTDWNRLTHLTCDKGLSFKILENKSYAVYKVECLDGIGYAYAEDNNNTFITETPAYKVSEPYEKGYNDFRWNATANGKEIAKNVTSDELVDIVKKELKWGFWEIKINRADL